MKQADLDKMADIYAEAKLAGDLAVRGKSDGMPCGFAWVKIRPASGKFVSWCKLMRIGRVDRFEGGYYIGSMQAAAFAGQNVEVKYAGCSAFVEVLKKHGINATAHERLD